jgi:adenosylcobyric acid synthase
MIQGCTSSAGKSLIATVLCRHFARLGVRVAPFKGQNMSNHARVGEGGELGAAQYFQALAAGVAPDVRMNPVLVKPEGGRQSQVVVLGAPDAQLSRTPWRERGARLRPTVLGALDSLAHEYELLVLEGAGSPVEINLADCDLANLAVAQHARARVLLVADIDRGGAFAHLYGTWSLLAPLDRERIAGFILNRFRGERELLAPAPQRLREHTGVPTLGVVPEISHGLPEEDGAARAAPPASGPERVAVVRYPTASNLDELSLIEQVATLEWARFRDCRRVAMRSGMAPACLPTGQCRRWRMTSVSSTGRCSASTRMGCWRTLRSCARCSARRPAGASSRRSTS